ncbi:MAG: iron-containing alcohol dehydrogenase [Spongiibacteraceae bacterium]
MADYAFNTVKHLRVERGALSRLDMHVEEFCQRMGVAEQRAGRRVLLVTDPYLVQSGLIAPGVEVLRAAGFDVAIFSDVQPDPADTVVLAAVAAATVQRAALVIGIGGGSSMDVAKLVACLANASADLQLSDLYGVNTRRVQRLPLLLIPTTAGTGSEVTGIAIVTTGESTKAGIVNESLLADQVLLDAELTLKLPAAVTAATGIDAMVHAIEAYTSIHRKNPTSDLLAREALRLLSGNLVRVVEHGDDIDAREQMLLGAMLAGQAFENAPVAAVHALAYPLGGIFHIAHGVSNALVLPHVLRFNRAHAEPLYAELAEIIVPACSGSTSQRCDVLIDTLVDLMTATKIPQRLRDFDIAEKHINELAESAMTQQRLLRNNPREVTLRDAADIYRQAF